MTTYNLNSETCFGLINLTSKPVVLDASVKVVPIKASEQSRQRSVIIAYDKLTQEVVDTINCCLYYREQRQYTHRSADVVVTKSSVAQGPVTAEGRKALYNRVANIRRTESKALKSVGCVCTFHDGILEEVAEQFDDPFDATFGNALLEANTRDTLAFVLKYYPQLQGLTIPELTEKLQTVIRNSGIDTYTAGTCTYRDKAVIYQNPDNKYRELVGGNGSNKRTKEYFESTLLDVLHQFLEVVADAKTKVEGKQVENERRERCLALAEDMVVSEPARYLTADELATITADHSTVHGIMRTAVDRLADELFNQNSGELADINPEWL